MAYFLVLQTTYEYLEIGLFKDHRLLYHIKKDRSLTSKYITVFLDEILTSQQLTLKDISFFAANNGPAPITTLRVILATLNGLAFSTCIPLVAVDGLTEFLNINKQENLTIALFNAFSEDIFYAYNKHAGYKNIDSLLQELKNTAHQQSIIFMGQGAVMFEEKIKLYFESQAIIKQNPLYLTLEQLGPIALKNWHAKLTHQELLPRYIKNRAYIPSS